MPTFTCIALLRHLKCSAGVRVVFIDGNHMYDGVSTDFAATESIGDVFVFHDVNSGQFIEHVMKFFNEVRAKPEFECVSFIETYPTSPRDCGFGIGVCSRRSILKSLRGRGSLRGSDSA